MYLFIFVPLLCVPTTAASSCKDVSNRENCGYPFLLLFDIIVTECHSRGCCYDNTNANSYNCFYHYSVGTNGVSWEEGFKWCQANGRQLVTIHSESKQSSLIKFLTRHNAHAHYSLCTSTVVLGCPNV